MDDLPGWLQRIVDSVRGWAFSGPWWAVMVKTALTHAALWTGAVLLGALVGLAVHLVFGLHPFWAFAFPLAGFSVGHDFYFEREYGPDGDSRKDGWKAKLDSALDYFLPRLLAGGALYGVLVLGAWGAAIF